MLRRIGLRSTTYQHVKSAASRSISSSRLSIDKSIDFQGQEKPKNEDLQFGKVLSPAMLTIEWDTKNGWRSPHIGPTQDLHINPAAACLNYGASCFEGMKAYKALSDQSLRLFRPDLNMARLKRSMERLQMPGFDFDPAELIECIKALVKVSEDWIPYGEGYSLYLRPNCIATNTSLGLAVPDSVLLYIVTSPVGPYYKTGFQPVRLQSQSSYVRAWRGGTGNAKVGGNYAPTFKPQQEAADLGYSQVLWLVGDDITEVGAMNVFFVIRNDVTGRKELWTPPLERGDILPGVTRQSVIDLANSWDDIDVKEKNITMTEVKAAWNSGNLIEAFGAGTACVVTPIECIFYEGSDIDIKATGEITQKVWDDLTGIQYGTLDDLNDWSVKI